MMPPDEPGVAPPRAATRWLLAPLRRMLETRLDRDGRAAAVERLPSSGARDEDAGEREPSGRRERTFGLPQEILGRALSQKILDGWLQNRHQTLVPLTFRLGRLDAADVELLMRFTAVALLNASAADEPARRAIERWLAEIGALPSAVEAFRAALAAPSPLSRLLADVRERELAPYAYAAAVVAADIRDPAGRLFADYVGARLALPADAVRSVDRRYRR